MRRSLIVILVGLALVAAACGDTSASTTEPGGGGPADPAVVTSGEGTTSPAASSTPADVTTTTTSDTPVGFPLTVSTEAGWLTIDVRPERIVSMSATHTEMLYAVGAGAQVVATDLTSNYPPAAEETARVDSFNFDAEEVAALRPDLVVLAFDFAGEMAAFEVLGIPALLLGPASTIEDAYDQIVTIGRVTGHQLEAELLVVEMTEAIDAAIARAARSGEASVFHEVDALLYSPNSDTFLGDIYARLGLVNIADEVPDEFGSGYVQVSAELILGSDPDFIFLGDAAFGESLESVAGRPGWDSLSAVAAGRVFELDGDIAGRWGPRTSDLVEAIAAAIGPGTDTG